MQIFFQHMIRSRPFELRGPCSLESIAACRDDGELIGGLDEQSKSARRSQVVGAADRQETNARECRSDATFARQFCNCTLLRVAQA